MSDGIFVSYRRDDAAYAAGRLVDRLQQTYQRDQLVIDVDAVEPGLDFLRVLVERIDTCAVLLAIIGPKWLDIRDNHGVRRLDLPLDVVRIEIEYALKNAKRVIPILIDGAEMPHANELPAVLRDLSRCNAIRLSHDRFRVNADELISLLAKVVKPRSMISRWTHSRTVPSQGRVDAFLAEFQRIGYSTAQSQQFAYLPEEQNGVRFLPIMMPNSIYMERFLIKAHLGRGGFSDVYLAQDRNDRNKRDVTLKVVRLDQQTTSVKGAIEKELAAAELLRSARIPGLVPCLETGVLPNRYGGFIVQEYIPSESLRAALAERIKFSVREALPIAISLCDTLDLLHTHGIVHCDVKPGNILLPYDRPLTPYLTDAGGARFLLHDLAVPDESPGFIVTVPYAPVELWTCGRFDRRVDVYSLGVTLLDMVQGLPQVEAQGMYTFYDFASTAVVTDRDDDPRPPLNPERAWRHSVERLNALANDNLKTVLKQAMALLPDDRFKNTVEFKQQLEALLLRT